MSDASRSSPLLRVPLEIRLLIYQYLLVDDAEIVQGPRNLLSLPDYHEYENAEKSSDPPGRILSFRNVPFNVQKSGKKLRTTYKVRSGRFRAQCMDMIYDCVNKPDINPVILRVNKQIHKEAARLLYTSYTFDFDTNIEACVPFLADLTPYSRCYIKHIGIVKRALPYEKDFDRCEWASMCNFIATKLSLTTLSLGVVSGKPIIGWDGVRQFPESDFDGIVQQYKRDEMQWVRDLMTIKGLRSLNVRPCIEHCPPPGSNAMDFFVTFSASVAGGFSDYLTNQMLHIAQAA